MKVIEFIDCFHSMVQISLVVLLFSSFFFSLCRVATNDALLFFQKNVDVKSAGHEVTLVIIIDPLLLCVLLIGV